MELFWAPGKKSRTVSGCSHFDSCKMKDAVNHLPAGWHGNEQHLFASIGRAPVKWDCVGGGDENHPHKKGADCQKLCLARHAKKSDQVFIPVCPGLSGTFFSLVPDDGLQP
jgi:hypothetical protein